MSSDQAGEAGDAVTRKDLPRFFAEAAEASRARVAAGAARRIGVEVEWLPIDPATGAARPYEGPGGVEESLRALGRRGFVDPTGAARTTHLRRGDTAINLEPGAQVELSGAPAADLHRVSREIAEVGAALREAADDAGFWLVAHGLQPLTLAEAIAPVPKRRYAAMAEHFLAHGGPRALDMMRLTGSVQVSLDFTSEEEAGSMLRAALLLAPVVAALCAGSPIHGGLPTGRQSERTAIWLATDPGRTGPLASGLDGDFAFERLVDELLLVPSILLRAEDGSVRPSGARTFGQLLAGGEGAAQPTRADWDLLLSTVFTDARLKRVVECRAADAPPPDATLAPAALYVGILYDAEACEGATALLAGFADRATYLEGMRRAADMGLRGRAPDESGRTFQDLAQAVLDLAEQGLARRDRDEQVFLDPLFEVASSGVSFADRALDAFARGGVVGLARQARW